LVFRRPITRALASGPLRHIKAGPFEVDWDRAALDAAEALVSRLGEKAGQSTRLVTELADLASRSPRLAIRSASERIESRLRDMTLPVDPMAAHRAGLAGIAELAKARGLINAKTAKAVEGLAVMSTMAMLYGDEPTTEKAMEFLALADGVMFAIGSPSPPG